MKSSAKTKQAPGWLFSNLAEAIKNARKQYLIYIGIISYCALSILTTTDRQIVLNEGIQLPIINLNVPVFAFYIISPLLVLIIYIYYQLHLQKAKAIQNELMENYSLESENQIYPWIIISPQANSRLIENIKGIIIELTQRWLLLGILILFVFGIIRKHDESLLLITGNYLIIGVFVIAWFWDKKNDTIDGEEHFQIYQWLLPGMLLVYTYSFFETYTGRLIIIGAYTIFSVALFFFLWNSSNNKQASLFSWRPQTWLQFTPQRMLILSMFVFLLAFRFLLISNVLQGDRFFHRNLYLFVDLSYQKLVTEPTVDYDELYWQNLGNINLAGALLKSCILKRADMRGAKLKRAKLESANLESINLSSANLFAANLINANLQNAKLKDVNLRNADLTGANLKDVDMRESFFKGANFTDADLTRANLENTEGLSVKQLCKARSLYMAKFDSTLFNILKENCPELLIHK